MNKGKSHMLNYLRNYIDYHEILKWRFLMPGTIVIINVGFLGVRTVKPSDIISFNMYLCLSMSVHNLVFTPLLYIIYHYYIFYNRYIYYSHYVWYKILGVYKITTS